MSDRPVRGLDPVAVEEELAMREPTLQGVGILLDPDLFCGLLRLHARQEPRAGRLVDVRYQPGTECVATYVFGDGAETAWVHARAVPRGERLPPSSASRAAEPPGFGRWVWDEYGLVVHGFPDDEGLPGLSALADGDSRAALLSSVLPEASGRGLDVRTISYDPGSRWVGCVEGASGPVAALHIHPPSAFDSARWNAQSLAAGEGLILPRPLGRSREHGALAHEWLPGRPLEHAILDPGLHEIELEGVGAAIASLHAQEPINLPHCPPAAGASSVRAVAGAVAFVLPRCGPRARKLSDRLVRRLVELPGESVPIHGNLKPGKVLLQGGGRVVLLDLDRACQGPRARDVGTLLAHVEEAAVAGRLGIERAAGVGEAIRRGYDRAANWTLRDRDVAFFTSLALFELSLRPFRCLMPDWPERAAAILNRAEQLFPA
jgi:hypothetical protein